METPRLPKEAVPAAAAVAGGAAVVAGAAGLRHRAHTRRDRERRYRLGRDEPAGDGLRRVARGQVEIAEEGLDRGDPAGVHDSRKALKRLRAAARLARPALGRERARAENRALRDVGRGLSAVRDAHVLVQTLDALRERYAVELPPGRFDLLRLALEREESVAAERLNGDGRARDEAAEALGAAGTRLASWPVDDADEALAAGFARIHKRGRRAYRAAREEPTDETLHEWRKRTKDLWYAARLLRPADPKRLKPLVRRAHELSNLLGDDHDLAVLAQTARTAKAARFADPAERRALLALIDRRRADLRSDAFALGAKVHRRKPRKLARRVAKGRRAAVAA